MKRKMKFPNIRLPSIAAFKEIAIIGGFLMLARGLYLIFPPLMWIVIGICLLWVGWPQGKAVNKS